MICFHRKRIRILFFSLLVSLLVLPSANVAQQKSDEVFLTVTVTDKSGQCADKLSKNDFVVYDGKTQQEITSFNVEDSLASIGIALDISGSMTNRNKSRLIAIKSMISRFIESGRKSDEYFVYAFDSDIKLLIDWTRAGKEVSESFDKIIVNRKAEGTVLYDACYSSIERLMRGAHSRRVFILISDGQDNSSRYKYKDLIALLKQSGVIVYSIGLLNQTDGLAGFGMSLLEMFSNVSGGKAFFPNSMDKLNQVSEQISAELECQYRIGFKPAARDGKWHSVNIKIAPDDKDKKNLSARYRPEYLASGAR